MFRKKIPFKNMVLNIFIVFFMVFSVLQIRAIDIDENILGIESNITYNDTKLAATITLDVSKVDSKKFIITEIRDENDNLLEVVDQTVKFNVNENKEYSFLVKYKEIEEKAKTDDILESDQEISEDSVNNENLVENSTEDIEKIESESSTSLPKESDSTDLPDSSNENDALLKEIKLNVTVNELITYPTKLDNEGESATSKLAVSDVETSYPYVAYAATSITSNTCKLTFDANGRIQFYLNGYIQFYSNGAYLSITRGTIATRLNAEFSMYKISSSEIIFRYIAKTDVTFYFRFTINPKGFDFKFKGINSGNSDITDSIRCSFGGDLAYNGDDKSKSIANFGSKVAVAYNDVNSKALSFIANSNADFTGTVGIGAYSNFVQVAQGTSELTSSMCSSYTTMTDTGGAFQFKTTGLTKGSSKEVNGGMSFSDAGRFQILQSGISNARDPNAGFTKESDAELGSASFMILNLGTSSTGIAVTVSSSNNGELYCQNTTNQTNTFTTASISSGSYTICKIYSRVPKNVDGTETITIRSSSFTATSGSYQIDRTNYTLNAKIVDTDGRELVGNNKITISDLKNNQNYDGTVISKSELGGTVINQKYGETKINWAINNDYMIRSITFDGKTLANDTNEYTFQGFEGTSLNATGKTLKPTYDLVITIKFSPPIRGQLNSVIQESFELPSSESTTTSQKRLNIGFSSNLIQFSLTTSTTSDAYISENNIADENWAESALLPVGVIKVKILSSNATTGVVESETYDLKKTYYLHVRNQNGNVTTTILDLESGVQDGIKGASFSDDGSTTNIPLSLKETQKDVVGYTPTGISEVGYSLIEQDETALNAIQNLNGYQKYENTSTVNYTIAISKQMQLEMKKNKQNVVYVYLKDKVGNISQIPVLVSDSYISMSFPTKMKVVAYRGNTEGVISPKLRITNYSQSPVQTYINNVSSAETNTLKLANKKSSYTNNEIALKIVSGKNFGFTDKFLIDCTHYLLGVIDNEASGRNYGEIIFDGFYSKEIKPEVNGDYYLQYYFAME